jgi:hypothetical protein
MCGSVTESTANDARYLSFVYIISSAMDICISIPAKE